MNVVPALDWLRCTRAHLQNISPDARVRNSARLAALFLQFHWTNAGIERSLEPHSTVVPEAWPTLYPAFLEHSRDFPTILVGYFWLSLLGCAIQIMIVLVSQVRRQSIVGDGIFFHPFQDGFSLRFFWLPNQFQSDDERLTRGKVYRFVRYNDLSVIMTL